MTAGRDEDVLLLPIYLTADAAWLQRSPTKTSRKSPFASEETFQLNDRVPGPTTVVCVDADWPPPKVPLWAEKRLGRLLRAHLIPGAAKPHPFGQYSFSGADRNGQVPRLRLTSAKKIPTLAAIGIAARVGGK